MDRATLHTFLGSMPEAEEYVHGDHPAFRIRGRPRFATMLDDEGVNLFPGKADIRHFVEHHPDHCTERWWGQKLAAVRLAYPDAPDDLVHELVIESWSARAPKRLLNAFTPPGS
jgi:hypothetical protein